MMEAMAATTPSELAAGLSAAMAAIHGPEKQRAQQFQQYCTLRKENYRRLIDHLQSLALLMQPPGSSMQSAPHQAAWREIGRAHV